MADTIILTVACSLVATLFGLLVLVLGWLGNKIYTKLDEMSKSLIKIAGDLHERINGLDRRVTVIETICKSRHSD